MIKHYLSGKKVRAALAIEAEWLSRIPDVRNALILTHIIRYVILYRSKSDSMHERKGQT